MKKNINDEKSSSTPVNKGFYLSKRAKRILFIFIGILLAVLIFRGVQRAKSKSGKVESGNSDLIPVEVLKAEYNPIKKSIFFLLLAMG